MVDMCLFRVAAMALAASSLVSVGGQLLALAEWEGNYRFLHHLISDLGMTTCVDVLDDYGFRFVCSPGHLWFNVGTVVSGALLAVGGAVLFCARPLGRTVGGALALSGVAVALVGVAPYDVNASLHDTAALFQAALTWLAMGVAVFRGRSVFRGATIVLLGVSVLSFIALVTVGTEPFVPGLLERLSFDTLTLWILLLAVALWRAPVRGKG